MITSLANRLHSGDAFATLVCSVDFSSAVASFGSAEDAATAIGGFFNEASAGLDCYVHHDSLFSASTPATVATWQNVRQRFGMAGVRFGWASSEQPATGFAAWSMMIASRANGAEEHPIRDYASITADCSIEELLRLAAKTPPVWARPPQTRPVRTRVISPNDVLLQLDFVGYTTFVEGANGEKAGRDLQGELRDNLGGLSSPHGNLLRRLFPIRVAQQIELEGLLARLDRVASEHNVAVGSTTSDGSPGSDGRTYGVDRGAARELLRDLSAVIDHAGYPFVGVIASPTIRNRRRLVDACLAWVKIQRSRGGPRVAEIPCLGCQGFGDASTEYESRQMRYLVGCPNSLPS